MRLFLAVLCLSAASAFLTCGPNALGNLFSCTDSWCNAECNSDGYAIGTTPNCVVFCGCSSVNGDEVCAVIPPYNDNTNVYTPEWCVETCSAGDCPTSICTPRCECGVREKSWEAYSLDDFYYEDILEDIFEDSDTETDYELPVLSIYVGQVDLPITREVVARVDTCGSDALLQAQIVWKPNAVQTLLSLLGVTIQQIDSLPNDLSEVTEEQLEELYYSLMTGPLPDIISEGEHDIEDFMEFLDSLIAGFQIGNCDDGRKLDKQDFLFSGAILDVEVEPGMYEITIIKTYYEPPCGGKCLKLNTAHSSTPLSLSCEEEVEYPTLYDFSEFGNDKSMESMQKSTGMTPQRMLALATGAALNHSQKKLE